MRKNLIMMVVVGFGLTSVIASAKGTKATGTYGMSGCGDASFVIVDKSWDAQLAADLTYQSYTAQSSAITSGTSNCVASKTELTSVELKVFMQANMVSLSKEAAQGHGEHLQALSEVFGCNNLQKFNQISQKSYSIIFKDTDPQTVLNNYHEVIKADSVKDLQCSRVG